MIFARLPYFRLGHSESQATTLHASVCYFIKYKSNNFLDNTDLSTHFAGCTAYQQPCHASDLLTTPFKLKI